MQSTVTFIGIFVLSAVLGFIPIIGWILIPVLYLLSLVLWLLLMYKAYVGERFKLPVVGDFAEKQV